MSSRYWLEDSRVVGLKAEGSRAGGSRVEDWKAAVLALAD